MGSFLDLGLIPDIFFIDLGSQKIILITEGFPGVILWCGYESNRKLRDSCGLLIDGIAKGDHSQGGGI